MNKKILFTFYFIIAIAVAVFAQQYDNENEFEIFCEKNEVTITKYIGSKTEVRIPPRIQNMPVTKIRANAFTDCKGLTSVFIPYSVDLIDFAAFYKCYSLTAINIDASNSRYASENGVMYNKNKNVLLHYPIGKKEQSFEIPFGVTTIGIYAFENCENLKNISIPNSVTSINYLAFIYCKNLTGIVIPNSVTYIGFGNFIGCSSLEYAIISESIDSIEDNIFASCKSLKRVVIPDSVKGISFNTFSECTSLTSVKFQGTILSIDFSNGAFCDLGDLRDKFYATDKENGTPGTYMRESGGMTWTRK